LGKRVAELLEQILFFVNHIKAPARENDVIRTPEVHSLFQAIPLLAGMMKKIKMAV